MNKIFKYSPVLLVTILFLASGCTKLPNEITTLETNRLFSPLNLDVRVVNKTSVRLAWNQVAKAQSYDIEIFENGNLDFSGSPVISLNQITFDQLPYTIDGLDGETDFSVRVKAVGEDISDSKWVADTFKTDAEQIFQQVDKSDIEATSVVLRWTPGLTVTKIVLNPGNIVHEITAGEKAEGAATIEGLTGETEYTAQILNGAKVRGVVSFTTLIDLGNVIQVNPGDDLDGILAAANDGDAFGLMPGEYNISSLSITKSVTLQGVRPTDRPVLRGTIIHVKEGVSLSLKDLVLDGSGSTGDQTFVFDDAGNNGDFAVEDCDIKNYTKGVMYVNKATRISSVTFKGNIIHDVECNGGDFIDFRQGLTDAFEFSNNTVYNSALQRDLFRMDAGGSGNFPGVNSVITISNNTFYQFCDGTGRRVLYIRLANHEINFNKNILANSQGQYSNQAATTISVMNANNYFNAPNYFGSTASGAHNDAGGYTTFEPGFANASAGDFTLSNEELKFQQIGDTRWIK